MIRESESQGRVIRLTGEVLQLARVLGGRIFVNMIEATLGLDRAKGLAFAHDGSGWLMPMGYRDLLALGAHHGGVSVGAVSHTGYVFPREVGGGCI